MKKSKVNVSAALSRWTEINSLLRTLRDEQYDLEEELRHDFISMHTATYSLPMDATLNWRSPQIVVAIDYKTQQPVVELRELEYNGILNGRDSKTYKQGTTFIVLKSWKTGRNTKGTHYLLFDKKTKRVANFYG